MQKRKRSLKTHVTAESCANCADRHRRQYCCHRPRLPSSDHWRYCLDLKCDDLQERRRRRPALPTAGALGEVSAAFAATFASWLAYCRRGCGGDCCCDCEFDDDQNHFHPLPAPASSAAPPPPPASAATWACYCGCVTDFECSCASARRWASAVRRQRSDFWLWEVVTGWWW